ncbi:SDR family oxidoreductase [Kitasatospora camelliae]|uniref:NAD(P)H-binding protein n=1 Tax=Kitasatospora camelliae TaxID=3156397 RepID=A0AAU8JNM7_9ACTN
MIVITAPTGNIGRHLLARLLESAPVAGEELRVIVRDPARLPDAARGRVEVVTGSHADAEVLDRAFDGADAVFWLVPPDASLTPYDTWSGFTLPAVKALADHGVGHVVGVSALGLGAFETADGPSAEVQDDTPVRLWRADRAGAGQREELAALLEDRAVRPLVRQLDG